WLVGRSTLPGDPLHGLGFQILEGSADYYWVPSLGPFPAGGSPRETARRELREAVENWRRTLEQPDPDRQRQLLWRGLHGLIGVGFYDDRWSTEYASLSTPSRLVPPVSILAPIVCLLAAPWRAGARNPKALGLLLLGLLLGQNLLLGSNPRYVLPFLPALLLFALCVGVPLWHVRWIRRIATVVL